MRQSIASMKVFQTKEDIMSKSTIDPDNADNLELDRAQEHRLGEGHDIDALGPSDSSDSGSDMVGTPGRHGDTDATGTGERASVERSDDNTGMRDIDVDRIEQGLGPDDVDE